MTHYDLSLSRLLSDRAEAAESEDAAKYLSAAEQLWRTIIVRNLAVLLPSLTLNLRRAFRGAVSHTIA